MEWVAAFVVGVPALVAIVLYIATRPLFVRPKTTGADVYIAHEWGGPMCYTTDPKNPKWHRVQRAHWLIWPDGADRPVRKPNWWF